MNQGARKVVRRTTCRTVGYFASLKMGQPVPWESLLELQQIKRFETDGRVKFYWAQPECVRYVIDGKQRKYFPDFRVQLRSGTTYIVEVKYSDDAEKPENVAKYRAITDHYRSRGQRFELATEQDIRRQPRLANAEILLNAGRRIPTKLAVFQWQARFDAAPPVTLADLVSDEASPEFRALLHLARLGHFDIALDHSPIGPNTAILSGFRSHP
jgi:hypothetical protein